MADIQGTLTKKIGPLPLWGWAAAAGGLVSVLYLARRGSAMGATATSGQPNVPYVPSPIIVTPGTMPDGTSSANPTPPPSSGTATLVADSTANPNSTSPASIPTYSVVSAGIQPVVTGLIANGTPLTPTGQTTIAKWGSGQNTFIQVTWLGGTTWVSQSDVRQSTGSGGGAGPSVVSLVPGSGGGRLLRHVGPHAHQQYLSMAGMGGGVQTGPWAQDPARGMAGMGGGGHARLQQVSQRTGLPMARLMSLNPPWKPRRHVHIA